MDADYKIQAFEGLINEASAAMADMLADMQAKSESGLAEEMSGALVDIASTLQQLNDKFSDAIKGLRIEAPAVNVTVQPAKVHIMPADTKGATWEVTIPDRYGREDRVMTIKRTK